MYVGAETSSARARRTKQNDYDGPMFKLKDDPRVTRVGGPLRRWSIDELPQILNVMRGEMSLVGPRPLWVEEAKQCRGWTQKRLDITPGITGLWQVLGRTNIPFDEMVKLDYMYVTGLEPELGHQAAASRRCRRCWRNAARTSRQTGGRGAAWCRGTTDTDSSRSSRSPRA